jgi:hypothetical protein
LLEEVAMNRVFAMLVVVPLGLTGCVHGDPDPVDPHEDDEIDALVGCSPIFAAGLLPEYRVTIAPSEWAALEDEFFNRAENEEAGLNYKPYHPIGFEYDGVEVPNVMMRLKGQSSWWHAIWFDEDPKMQFVISFNSIDRRGRFMGLRKLDLDMPRSDESFLWQRLALDYMRRAGIEAQCANNARLVINGAYYGLYTNLERPDKEYRQRIFPDAYDGDMWAGGRVLKNNEDTFTWHRLDRFWYSEDRDEILSLIDVDASVRVWAAEAMIPHGDGYYNGRPNFYLYDHPTRGFLWLPHDLDSAFDWLPADTSPIFPECEGRDPRDRKHWDLVLSDPAWRDRYADLLGDARAFYDVAALEARVDRWADQIAVAAADDPMKPFTTTDHAYAVDRLRGYMAQRAAVVDDWLDCSRPEGVTCP